MKRRKEQDLVRACLNLLRLGGIPARRFYGGAVFDPVRKKYRALPNADRGWPDIVGILQDGRFLGIECKSPSGRLTPEQNSFLTIATARKAVVGVVKEIDDLVQLLEQSNAEEANTLRRLLK